MRSDFLARQSTESFRYILEHFLSNHKDQKGWWYEYVVGNINKKYEYLHISTALTGGNPGRDQMAEIPSIAWDDRTRSRRQLSRHDPARQSLNETMITERWW